MGCCGSKGQYAVEEPGAYEACWSASEPVPLGRLDLAGPAALDTGCTLGLPCVVNITGHMLTQAEVSVAHTCAEPLLSAAGNASF